MGVAGSFVALVSYKRNSDRSHGLFGVGLGAFMAENFGLMSHGGYGKPSH